MLTRAHPYRHQEPREVSREEFESRVREGSCVEEDTLEELPTEEVVSGSSASRGDWQSLIHTLVSQEGRDSSMRCDSSEHLWMQLSTVTLCVWSSRESYWFWLC